MNSAAFYVPITKVSKTPEGHRIVTGVATSERLDLDGQRADYDWAKAAFGDWFDRWGNVREMHGRVAAGKALNIQFDDGARQIIVTSKAVDPGTIAKLDEGILKGYSWGSKSVPGNPIKLQTDEFGAEWIKGGALTELSYVDQPCNWDCTISVTKMAKAGRTLAKSAGPFNEDELGKLIGDQDLDMVAKVTGLSLGRVEWFIGKAATDTKKQREGAKYKLRDAKGNVKYPISDCSDVSDAWMLRGRSSLDRSRVEAHIKRAARALGCPVPGGGKDADPDLTKAGGCDCCDDCGPDCAGDCCGDCTMSKAAKAAQAAEPITPVGVVTRLEKLLDGEPDAEFHGLLTKVVGAARQWRDADGRSVSWDVYSQLAELARAGDEPELEKRRVFYSAAQRAAIEQAMQNLHQQLGLFMEGAQAADLDQDQRNRTLTGQDAPPVSDQPGAGPNTTADGVAGDGNLNNDPTYMQDGDMAVRQPTGADARAQGELGTATWTPAGDTPGNRSGRQDGFGAAPGATSPAPDAPGPMGRTDREGGEGPHARGGRDGRPRPRGIYDSAEPELVKRKKPKAKDKKVSSALAKLAEAVTELKQSDQEPAAMKAAIARVLQKGLKKVLKQQNAVLAELQKERTLTDNRAVGAAASVARMDQVLQEIQKGAIASEARMGGDTTLLAELIRAANRQQVEVTMASSRDARKAARTAAKRARRGMKAVAGSIRAEVEQLNKQVETLGRMPAPGGPITTRVTDRAFPVNETVERAIPGQDLERIKLLKELATSSDRTIAAGAQAELRKVLGSPDGR